MNTPSELAPGMVKCGYECTVCPNVNEIIYDDPSFVKIYNCNSYKAIYLITCNNCQDQYVGYCKESLQQRHAFHLKEIAAGVTPFGRHFRQCGSSNMKVQVNTVFPHIVAAATILF